LTRLLIVTAVAAERDAILAAVPDGVTVVAGGVGPACSAAATAVAITALGLDEQDLVVSAGIAGGFGPVIGPVIGQVAVASSIVFADLGAETADGFDSLGIAASQYRVGPRVCSALAQRTGGVLGPILTVATVTGTRTTADALLARHPEAVAEAMEGAGVAAAAALCGVPFAEVRAISNLVGPRDRAAWRIPEALEALGAAFAAITATDLEFA
jgi:futalosine hydrolase